MKTSVGILMLLIANFFLGVNIPPVYAQLDLTEKIPDTIAPFEGKNNPDLRRVMDSEKLDSITLYKDYGEIDAQTVIYKDDETGQFYAVISQLPVVNGDREIIDPRWIMDDDNYITINNTYDARISPSGQVAITFPYHDIKPLIYHPQVIVSGIERDFLAGPVLLADDYFGNENYTQNCIIFDYGFCVRLYRQIEGQLQGYWIFDSAPDNDVLIRYNQVGTPRLILGSYAIDADSELMTAEAITQAAAMTGWPVIGNDTLTVYPDADPETSTVDGHAQYYNAGGVSFGTIRGANGTHSNDSNTTAYNGYNKTTGTSKYVMLFRSIYLFDTSGLPDTCTIDSATFSLYGQTKQFTNTEHTISFNVYESNPASNTAIGTADYNYTAWNDTALSDTALAEGDLSTGAYNDWNLNASGIAAISKDGITKLGLRWVNDATNTDPTINQGNEDYFIVYTAEQGAGYKPKLYIEYSSDTLPTVTTQACDDITSNSFNAHGTITDAGTGTPSQRGFCYTTSGTPTTADDTVSEAWVSGTGAYTLPVSGLSGSTTYFVRAYAITSVGTGYGTIVETITLAATGTEAGECECDLTDVEDRLDDINDQLETIRGELLMLAQVLLLGLLIIIPMWKKDDWLRIICGIGIIPIGVNIAINDDLSYIYGVPFMMIGLLLAIWGIFSQSRKGV